MNTRAIPATGEPLPVIGCGTYLGFDRAPGSAAYAALPGVVEALLDAGGRVLDSSPMYGRAEATVGELLAANGRRGEAFLATKVWTRGRAAGERQMETSLRLLRTDRIDLMQIHNLLDWRTHLATLRRWEGRGAHPLPRHHALHGFGVSGSRVGAEERARRLPADQLFRRGA
jgi:diketogulonate reductase-like aldo/keto reductase